MATEYDIILGDLNKYSYYTVVDSNYTILSTGQYNFIRYATLSTDRVLTLPLSSLIGIGRSYIIYNGTPGTYDIIVTCDGPNTIIGKGATCTVGNGNSYESYEFITISTNSWVFRA